MIGELLCPDCGGVVGATETTEAGAPCKCFTQSHDDQSHDTISDEQHRPVVVEKRCRLCGKDVTGQKRVRDHLGYYCYSCHKEEEKRENQGRVRCGVCGRLVKEETLTPYEGTKMCHKCHEERTEAQKQVIKRMGFKGARTREEVRQLKIYLVMAGVLGIIILYGTWHMMRG